MDLVDGNDTEELDLDNGKSNAEWGLAESNAEWGLAESNAEWGLAESNAEWGLAESNAELGLVGGRELVDDKVIVEMDLRSASCNESLSAVWEFGIPIPKSGCRELELGLVDGNDTEESDLDKSIAELGLVDGKSMSDCIEASEENDAPESLRVCSVALPFFCVLSAKGRR
ncbi:hypothetical protein JTE90_020631 [Oedothorax gibbosus]|uniref:Uncharacterized protein n=1 Tax=Oedothorax gibbosus TaxID=931172 RepID=A0AAV6TTZ7_9ARAC|nr:hypothetical protein JTE90_020631 [Oedothorax gibbosus]